MFTIGMGSGMLNPGDLRKATGPVFDIFSIFDSFTVFPWAEISHPTGGRRRPPSISGGNLHRGGSTSASLPS
ncbi:MAG: hypothetical protein DMG41_33495 [Acidobacteria bacterium]|nr:MAG: hypothetical protein AUH13_00025 [Acidobacteria bacterium 13_2_20CM_58_27]PYT67644.1 MAG: hypothetical protein DMG42_26350 [Acidobacteriota bacterium]PYT82308.1 MAG: hypothetical protein DMG41_33495 [Acidobacteriota bacterium]